MTISAGYMSGYVRRPVVGVCPVMDYEAFLHQKSQLGDGHGFEPVWMPEFLFDFQRELVEWAILEGR